MPSPSPSPPMRRRRYPAEPAARRSTASPPSTSSGMGTEDGPDVSVVCVTASFVVVSAVPVGVVSVGLVPVELFSVEPLPVEPLPVELVPVGVDGGVGRRRRDRACPASRTPARGRSPPWRWSSRRCRAGASRSPPCSTRADRSCRRGRRRTSRRSPGRRTSSSSPIAALLETRRQQHERNEREAEAQDRGERRRSIHDELCGSCRAVPGSVASLPAGIERAVSAG